MLLGLGSSLTDQIAAAITRQEGTTQNNNPGNLMAIPGVTYPGQSGTDYRGFAVFNTYQDGLNQLDKQIDLNIGRGLTLQQFFCGGGGYAGYAPGAQCGPYVSNVSSWTGIDPNQVLADAGGSFDSTTGSDWGIFGDSGDGSDSGVPSWLIPAVAGLGILGILMARR
jgi:hypothetical protein